MFQTLQKYFKHSDGESLVSDPLHYDLVSVKKKKKNIYIFCDFGTLFFSRFHK